MKKTQKKATTLKEKLMQFGLDPRDWIIDSNGKGFFDKLLLINRDDPNFRLIGEKTNQGWKDLQLLSI